MDTLMLSSPASPRQRPAKHCGLTELLDYTEIAGSSSDQHCEGMLRQPQFTSQPGFSGMDNSQLGDSQTFGCASLLRCSRQR